MLVWSGLDSIGPDLIPPKEYKLELAKGMIIISVCSKLYLGPVGGMVGRCSKPWPFRLRRDLFGES